MRRFKFGLVLAMLVVLGAVAASSAMAALPKVSLLKGETFPVTGEGTGKGSKLETVSGSKLEGTGFTVKLTQSEAGSLGLYKATFTGVKEGKNPCKTAGAAKEEVLVDGDYHWVPFFDPTLLWAIIFLVTKEFTIECGEPTKIKIKVKGSAISDTNLVKGTDTESVKGNLKCAAGKKGVNEITEYENDEGKLVKGILESNFGLGFEQSCEQSNEVVTIKTSKMIVLE